MVEEIQLTNTIKGVTINLNQTNSEYILDSVNWGVVESSRVTYKYVNQAGVQVTDIALETRDISIIGWVCTRSDNLQYLTQLKKSLNSFVNPMESMQILYKNYTLNFFPDNSIRWGTELKTNNEVMAQFKIDGFCAEPLFRSKNDSRVLAGVVEPMFYFPLVIPKNEGVIFGLRREYIILGVNNAGDVTTGFRIEFIATKGSVTNPQLINTKTQEFIKINKVLQRGEKVIINTVDGEKYVHGKASDLDPEENYYKYRDIMSTWLKLEVGDNLFKYDAEVNVNNLEVRIYYNNRYLEVQE